MAPQGSQFSQGLRAGYFGLAASQKAQTDLADEAHFTRKAVASAKGLNVQPDMVALRNLPADRVPEFEAARARLLSALDRGGRLKAAEPAARAQVSYDCWLEETASGNTQAAADCQKGFEDAMREVESALATGVGNEYVVFFAWDQADVTPVTQQVLEQVAADYKKGKISRVAIAGHADRSGSPDLQPAPVRAPRAARRRRAGGAGRAAGHHEDRVVRRDPPARADRRRRARGAEPAGRGPLRVGLSRR